MYFPQTKYQVGVKEQQSKPDFHTAGLLEAVILYQKEAKDGESVEPSKEGGSQSRAGAESESRVWEGPGVQTGAGVEQSKLLRRELCPPNSQKAVGTLSTASVAGKTSSSSPNSNRRGSSHGWKVRKKTKHRMEDSHIRLASSGFPWQPA